MESLYLHSADFMVARICWFLDECYDEAMDIVVVRGTDEDDLIDVEGDDSYQTNLASCGSLPQKDNVRQPFSRPNSSILDRISQPTGSKSCWKTSILSKRPAVSRQAEAENNSNPLSPQSVAKNFHIPGELASE